MELRTPGPGGRGGRIETDGVWHFPPANPLEAQPGLGRRAWWRAAPGKGEAGRAPSARTGCPHCWEVEGTAPACPGAPLLRSPVIIRTFTSVIYPTCIYEHPPHRPL